MTDDDRTPAGDKLPAVDETQTWQIAEVWQTSTGLSYERHGAHAHVEPRQGDLMEYATEAVEDLVQARARNEFVSLLTPDGKAVLVNPANVVAIEVMVIGPDGEQVDDLQPGRLGTDGGVMRHNPYDGKPLV